MAREVAQGIFEIDTKPLGHEQLIASFLVLGSEKNVLIDPGFPSSADTVLNEVKDLGVEPATLDFIALTHSHIDHAGSVGSIAKTASIAKIVTHQRGGFYLKNSIKIGGGSKMIFGDLAEDLGQPIDTPDNRILTVAEGDSIDLGDKTLTVQYTPGHSGDHVSFFETSTGTLFTGDTGCIHFPQLGHVLIPAGSPPIYRSDYILEELKRFSDLNPKTILTPHYGKAHLEPGSFITQNIEAVTQARRKIDQMFRQGMEFPQVIEKLRTDIIKQSGNTEIPTFLSDVWLRIMLNTGLMGFMADILQYARDIRPFTESLGGTETE